MRGDIGWRGGGIVGSAAFGRDARVRPERRERGGNVGAVSWRYCWSGLLRSQQGLAAALEC